MTAGLPARAPVDRKPAGARRASFGVRLLFLSPHYGTQGGVRLVIDAVAAAAHAAGHEVVAVTDDGGPAPAVDTVAVRFLPFPEDVRDWRRLRRFARRFAVATVQTARAVRRWRPDVVSVHCARRFAPYAGAVRRLTRAPVVVTLHEGTLPRGMPPHERLFRMLVRAGDAVTAVSAEGAAYAERIAGRHDVRVIANGYDPHEFADPGLFAHPRPYVAAVGRLDPQKGFDVLVEAIPHLPESLDVLIAGDGAERAPLAALADRLGVADRVRLLGATDRATTVALLRSAAVVACPSRWEGLPLVCLEAFAAGAPVVATAVNGVPEVVRDGETGLLVPPEDPQALAAAIRAVLADPAGAAARATRARALAEAEHQWAQVARRYLALFDEAARR